MLRQRRVASHRVVSHRIASRHGAAQLTCDIVIMPSSVHSTNR